MKLILKKAKTLGKQRLREIADFIDLHYDAPDHLKMSADELIISDLFCIVGLRNVLGADELVLVSFFKVITPTLARTQTTVIHSDYRGQGLGTKFNEFLEEKLTDLGVEKITTNIYTDNLPSLILKLKRGYIVEGTLYDHDELGKHEYIVGKFL